MRTLIAAENSGELGENSYSLFESEFLPKIRANWAKTGRKFGKNRKIDFETAIFEISVEFRPRNAKIRTRYTKVKFCRKFGRIGRKSAENSEKIEKSISKPRFLKSAWNFDPGTRKFGLATCKVGFSRQPRPKNEKGGQGMTFSYY